MEKTKIWEQEQERLEQVKEKLKAGITKLEPEVGQLNEQARDLRRGFWEEVTVDTNSQEDFEESFFTITQQEAVLSERERSHARKLRQWKSMQRLLPSPYFGRIDFLEEGQQAVEQVYIGVSSFAEADGLSFLIYDWRTPIASLYYDYPPGQAAFETPGGGQIEGTMELKRQYQIRGGQLQHLFDSSVTIGDELLQQVLGKGADSQMRSIVATIQAEQNAIIRNDSSRMLIVQGAAGSGKTSAALQRVAYLLYKHRGRLTADQIVLFRLIRCSTAMSLLCFLSWAKRTCSRRPSRSIWICGSGSNSRLKIRSIRWRLCWRTGRMTVIKRALRRWHTKHREHSSARFKGMPSG